MAKDMVYLTDREKRMYRNCQRAFTLGLLATLLLHNSAVWATMFSVAAVIAGCGWFYLQLVDNVRAGAN